MIKAIICFSSPPGGIVAVIFPFDILSPTENAPKIGVEISDLGLDEFSEGVKAYYEGATTMADIAKKAAAIEGADFVALILDGGDPNGANKSVEELIGVVKEVADAIDCPLVVEGCKNVEKDAELLPKVAEVLQGRNALLLSEKEENYKAIGAAAGLAYNQIVGAESAVDINLAKQLNVVTTQLGVDAKKIVMNIGSAAAGYGHFVWMNNFACGKILLPKARNLHLCQAFPR